MADLPRVYQNYVRFGDAELGRFVTGLREAGLIDVVPTVLDAVYEHLREAQRRDNVMAP